MNLRQPRCVPANRILRQCPAIVASIWGIFCLSACEMQATGLTEVSGVVTYRGKALSDGHLTFLPAAGDGRGASGTIGSEGHYELFTSKSLKGIAPGEYKVRIESWETRPSMGRGPPAKLAIPQKYYLANTTTLRATVEGAPSQTIDLTLED